MIKFKVVLGIFLLAPMIPIIDNMVLLTNDKHSSISVS